jgi:pimeloyl-ACP methyl ester carboxylesterase
MAPAMRVAREAGFTVRTVEGEGFRHRLFERGQPAGDPAAWVFIEGDGVPFVAGGRQVAADPSPRTPLALLLAAQTGGRVLYVGRPCYFGLAGDPGCRAQWWTDGRYSEAVVASMVAAVRTAIPSGRITLVGYSGGGTLAMLMAPRLADVRAVITVAADLDVAAWAERHGYTPLTESLDPAKESALPETIRVVHLMGSRDAAVPPETVRSYLAQHATEAMVRFDGFDHVCCWRERWPEILDLLTPWLNGTARAPPAFVAR